MIAEASLGDEFVDAIRRSLSPSETLAAQSQCYTEIWRERPNGTPQFFGFEWEHAALTNANLRFIKFQQRKVKTGFLSSRIDMIPEVASMQVVPIPQIVAVEVRQYTPARLPYRTLNRTFKGDVAPVMQVILTTAAGQWSTSSPFLEFQALVNALQSTITGSTLAHQSTSMVDAVSKMAQLRDAGLLTDDEFDRAKAGFIGRNVEVAESSAALIRQLAQLRDAGVLTDAEFRIKKWDILSRPG